MCARSAPILPLNPLRFRVSLLLLAAVAFPEALFAQASSVPARVRPKFFPPSSMSEISKLALSIGLGEGRDRYDQCVDSTDGFPSVFILYLGLASISILIGTGMLLGIGR